MEVSILAPTIGDPLPAVKWNYDELKAYLTAQLVDYKDRVYTPDNIKDARADRAKLNHVRDALDQRRRDVKSMYLDPYTTFEGQIKELTGMVSECSDAIDAQIKAVEAAEKEEKLDACRDIFAAWVKDLDGRVSFEQLQNPKWLNKGCSLDAVEEEIKSRLEQIRAGLSAIRGAASAEDVDAVTADYLETLDLARAIQRIESIKKARAMREQQEQRRRDDLSIAQAAAPQPVPRAQPQPDPEPVQEMPAEDLVKIVNFRVWATDAQLNDLRYFLTRNNIKYGYWPQK